MFADGCLRLIYKKNYTLCIYDGDIVFMECLLFETYSLKGHG